MKDMEKRLDSGFGVSHPTTMVPEIMKNFIVFHDVSDNHAKREE